MKCRLAVDCSQRSEVWETAEGRGAAAHALGQTLTLCSGLGSYKEQGVGAVHPRGGV